MLIQIVMVALIIAFPGIVSRGLDKAEKLDLDRSSAEMRQHGRRDAPPGADARATPPADGDGARAGRATGGCRSNTDKEVESNTDKEMEAALQAKAPLSKAVTLRRRRLRALTVVM